MAKGRAYILEGGEEPDDSLDRETGLTIWGAGWGSDKGREGIVNGYDRIVRLYVRWKGPPANSRKRWEGILFALNEYFDDRAKREPPQNLVAEGPPVLAPDGRTEIFLKSRPRFKTSNEKVYFLCWEPDVERYVWPWPRNGIFQYYPGPPGSDVLLLRGRMGRDFEVTEAFDLRFQKNLRYESRRVGF